MHTERTWTIAKWAGSDWEYSDVTTSDHNYDFGELILKDDNEWIVIGPTESGPQLYNPGGEIASWVSLDQGKTWRKRKQLTSGSVKNHTYVRQVKNAHPDFAAIWADGHGRKPSPSSLYLTDDQGNVFRFPSNMGAAKSTTMEKVTR